MQGQQCHIMALVAVTGILKGKCLGPGTSGIAQVWTSDLSKSLVLEMQNSFMPDY